MLLFIRGMCRGEHVQAFRTETKTDISVIPFEWDQELWEGTILPKARDITCAFVGMLNVSAVGVVFFRVVICMACCVKTPSQPWMSHGARWRQCAMMRLRHDWLVCLFFRIWRGLRHFWLRRRMRGRG